MTWLIPLTITLFAAILAIAKAPPAEGGFLDMTPLVWIFYTMVVVIVSLSAWLTWALLS